MTIPTRLLALALTFAVNLAAFAAADAAMGQIRLREQLAQLEPARITVSAPRIGQSMVAAGVCPPAGAI